MTRGQIVAEALLMVGNTSLTTRANFALNRALQRVYLSWPWPFLRKRASGLALPLGSGGLTFGNGSGGESQLVQRIIDPLWLYTADFSTQARPRIVEQPNPDLIVEESIQNPATFTGLPENFKVNPVAGTYGQWKLVPTPFPDKAYLLTMDYLYLPADIPTDSSGDSTTPSYPSTSTMTQMLLYEMALYNEAGQSDHSASNNEWEKLKAMIVEDRMRFGYSAGINESIGLDNSTFRRPVAPTSIWPATHS